MEIRGKLQFEKFGFREDAKLFTSSGVSVSTSGNAWRKITIDRAYSCIISIVMAIRTEKHLGFATTAPLFPFYGGRCEVRARIDRANDGLGRVN